MLTCLLPPLYIFLNAWRSSNGCAHNVVRVSVENSRSLQRPRLPFFVEYSRFPFPSMSHKALCCPSWALQNHCIAKREKHFQQNAPEELLLQASGRLKKRLAPICDRELTTLVPPLRPGTGAHYRAMRV